jgi:hypothetical protein
MEGGSYGVRLKLSAKRFQAAAGPAKFGTQLVDLLLLPRDFREYFIATRQLTDSA